MGATACLAIGCGDDGAPARDAGAVDAGERTDGAGGDATVAGCMPPALAPMPEDMSGACCYRVSNEDRLDAPELRLAALVLSAPASVRNVVIDALLRDYLDGELMNWMVSLTITGSTVTMTTGAGERHADGTFSFIVGDAPGPGDPNRWDPLTATGSISGETFSTAPIRDTLTVPVQDVDGGVLAELPLRDATLVSATLSEGRTCIGTRAPRSYRTGDGTIEGYMTVADAMNVTLDTDSLMATFCDVLRGQPTAGTNCAEPRSTWTVPPDSTCDASGCSMGGCTPDVCNAWRITAELAAHGVEITP